MASFLEAKLLEPLCASVRATVAIISSVIFYLEWTESNIFMTNFLQLTLLYPSSEHVLLSVSVRRQLTHWHDMRKKCSKTKQTCPRKITWWFPFPNLFHNRQSLPPAFLWAFPFLQSCHFFSSVNKGSCWINLTHTLTKSCRQASWASIAFWKRGRVPFPTQKLPGVSRGHSLSTSAVNFWVMLVFSMLCRWGMGLVGETVIEATRRELNLSHQTRSSGWSPLAFTLHYFRDKSGHPGEK